MDERTLAVAFAWARIALGTTAFLVPGPAVRVLTGSKRADGIEPQLARMLGARDLALGVGAAIALEKSAPVRGWMEAAALADAGDCIAALLGRKHMGRQAYAGTLVSTVGAVVVGVALARRLEPSVER